MRAFIVLCVCAMSLAAPQGYKYGQSAVSVQPAATSGYSGSYTGIAPSTAAVSFLHGAQGVSHSSFGGQQLVQHYQQHQPQVIVSKRFFIHSAPEDVDEEYKEKHITVGVPKKNYNVVFIKSPSRSNKKTAIKISPAPNEEKTVIYVLSHKSDAADVHAEIVEHPTTTAKPEVFFIKYKTNEEAHHAQEQIQAQYDALGGTSQVTDEGVAPVTSVVGSLGVSGDVATTGNSVSTTSTAVGTHVAGSATSSFGGVQIGGASGAAHSNAYLPPHFN